jgi:Fe2+ transport system protein FeoA
MSYGLVPGVRLKILQRVPATILKIHQTELALEHALTKAIYVLSEQA